jgi:hypothetical protein
MPDTDRIVGNESSWVFNGSIVPITSVTPKINRKVPDSTDSGDYNGPQDMIANTQIPASYNIEFAIEGRFRFSAIPDLFALAVTSDTQFPMTIGLDLTPTYYGSGLVDIIDFTTTIPVEDVVNYSCNVKTWGAWRPNTT